MKGKIDFTGEYSLGTGTR